MTEVIESRKASLDILTIIASFLVVLLHQAAQMESPSIYIYIYIRDEQNRQKEQPTNKANGNRKSLGHLRGAKTIAR